VTEAGTETGRSGRNMSIKTMRLSLTVIDTALTIIPQPESGTTDLSENMVLQPEGETIHR